MKATMRISAMAWLGGALALGACGGAMETPDGGGTVDGGGNPVDGGGNPVDGGGGGGVDTPAGRANAECSRLEDCLREVYRQTYGEPDESLSACTTTLTEGYTQAGLPGSTLEDVGTRDEAACQAALNGCTTLRASTDIIRRAGGLVAQGFATISACARTPGSVAFQGDCELSEQCMTGDYCQYQGATRRPGCRDGQCVHFRAEGANCNPTGLTEDPCNNGAGQYCLYPYDTGASGGAEPVDRSAPPTCRAITTQSNVGDTCAAESDRQCAPHLYCDTESYTCQAWKTVGQTCEVGQCDLGLSCLPTPGGSGTTCQTANVAEVGQQCGPVQEMRMGVTVTVNYICASAIAYCDMTGATPMCRARARFNEICPGGDTCRPPFVCRSEGAGTRCLLPEATPPMCN